MKYYSLLFAFLFLSFSAKPALGDEATYPEVLFSNSVLSGNFGHSLISYSGYSWVENVKGRMPLSDTLFFTPGNALSLKYTSSLQGHWEASINFPGGRVFKPDVSKTALSFYIYRFEEFDVHALPSITLLEGDSCTRIVELKNYIDTSEFPERKWVKVSIPLKDFLHNSAFVLTNGVQFIQGAPTGINKANHLLIDQIEFTPLRPISTELNAPAVLNSVKAGAQHVELEWQLPLDPAIRYTKVYRSLDGKQFEAVGLRPISALRYVDFVPERERLYHYKVTWVDYQFRESPFSDIFRVEVKQLGDEELLHSIQAAHINYFNRHVEVNSGMHKVDLASSEAIVDVAGTGYSLMVQTVAVQRGLVTPRLYLRRVGNLVNFLLYDAEQSKGMFPKYLDGRTGRGVHVSDTLSPINLGATASIAQGLFVVRQYLDSLQDSDRLDEAFERPRSGRSRNSRNSASASQMTGKDRLEQLAVQIDSLWNRMQWNAFIQGNEHVLYEGWSPEKLFANAHPLGGFGKDIIVYFLAAASSNYGISTEAYKEGLRYARIDQAAKGIVEGVDEVSPQDINYKEVDSGWGPHAGNIPQETQSEGLANYSLTPFRADTLVFGCYLEVGDLDKSLLDAYQSFLLLDPEGRQDAFVNYGEALERLTEAYKRRDNEMDAGISSPDIWGSVVHAKGEDLVAPNPKIKPAISIASLGFTPEIGMRAVRELYFGLGSVLFTENGFRDWINIYDHQVSVGYNPFHQAVVPIQIENYRSGLLRDLFMTHPVVKEAVSKIFVTE